ncbi:hypothetical protein [Microbulbifer elongatus]|uniref:hypothetical protein n=1 Tax=Microbulbifer elongatus TaxID=86173 RepID=UPI001CFD8251|nr:hypothetical protein [Microbulbifer elongatus]
MKILEKLFANTNAHTAEDELIYSLVAQELEQGSLLQGLWARANAHCDFDEAKAKGYYMRRRAEQLSDNRDKIALYLKTSAELADLRVQLAKFDQSELHSIKRDLAAADDKLNDIQRQATQAGDTARAHAIARAQKTRKYVLLTTAFLVPFAFLAPFSAETASALKSFAVLTTIAVGIYWNISRKAQGDSAAFDARHEAMRTLGHSKVKERADQLQQRLKELFGKNGNLEEQINVLRQRQQQVIQELGPLFPYLEPELV